jgi:AraC-like DNA-binding protein
MLGCSPRIADDAGLASPYVQFIFPPPDCLADYVASFWILVSRPYLPAPVFEHAFPSLGVKLIFNLGAPVRSASTAPESSSAFAISPRAYVLGARTTSVDLTLAPSTRLIGVQFTPAGAYPFVQASLHELTNRGVALDMVLPDIIALDERLAAAATMQQQIMLLAHLLAKQLERKPDRQLVAQHVITLLHTAANHQSIDQIAASLGISRRHLARLFSIQVGMPPKLCARLVRFQQALRQLAQTPICQPRISLLLAAMSINHTSSANFAASPAWRRMHIVVMHNVSQISNTSRFPCATLAAARGRS